MERTITEFIGVPDDLTDDLYLLNLSISNLKKMTLHHRDQYYFQFFIEILFCKTRIKRIFIPKFTENEIRYYRFKNFKGFTRKQ